MKANHKELLGLSFNGRLKNYFNDDFEYHNYNIGDLIMVEDKRASGDSYIAVGIIINKRYDEHYKTYQLNYVALSTGTCDYGCNWIAGTLEELDKKLIKHLPKYCIDEYLESQEINMKEEINEILELLRDGVKRPVVTLSKYSLDNICELNPNECKKLLEYIENLQSQLKAKEEAEIEFKKLLEDKWNESQDIWFIKLLNKYEEITSKQAKENDEILSKGENK